MTLQQHLQVGEVGRDPRGLIVRDGHGRNGHAVVAGERSRHDGPAVLRHAVPQSGRGHLHMNIDSDMSWTMFRLYHNSRCYIESTRTGCPPGPTGIEGTAATSPGEPCSQLGLKSGHTERSACGESHSCVIRNYLSLLGLRGGFGRARAVTLIPEPDHASIVVKKITVDCVEIDADIAQSLLTLLCQHADAHSNTVLSPRALGVEPDLVGHGRTVPPDVVGYLQGGCVCVCVCVYVCGMCVWCGVCR